MAGLDFLTTEDGTIITTEDGDPIIVSRPLSNDDIQFFDFSVNLLQSLLWQYNEAVNLQQLLEQKAAWYQNNQTDFWTEWVQNVFDLRTANDFGLAVWSIILNQPTYINNGPDTSGKIAWGFGPDQANFNNGNFSTITGNTYQLPTETARLLLLLRQYQIISSGTVPETNRMLKNLFGNFGSAYLLDSLNMSQRYYFSFAIPADMLLMLENFDILPRPAGVQSSIFQGAFEYFGFGMDNANFGNGGFAE